MGHDTRQPGAANGDPGLPGVPVPAVGVTGERGARVVLYLRGAAGSWRQKTAAKI